jgi:hypothetical protein
VHGRLCGEAQLQGQYREQDAVHHGEPADERRQRDRAVDRPCQDHHARRHRDQTYEQQQSGLAPLATLPERTEDLDEAGEQRPGAHHGGEGDRADAGPHQCQDASGELEQAEQQADPPAGPDPTAEPVDNLHCAVDDGKDAEGPRQNQQRDRRPDQRDHTGRDGEHRARQ